MVLSNLNTQATSVSLTISFSSLYYPLPAGAAYTGSAIFYIEIPEDFTGIP